MKKTTKKAFLMLAMSVLLLPCLFFAASAEGADAAQITDASFESVILNVGADETRRNITWYSQYDTTGEVRYAKANDLQNGALPENYLSAEARISKTSKSGYYFYKASMWGLEANTTYAYCLVTGNSVSEIYTFDVTDFGDDFSFVFVGDPQVGTEGGPQWSDTLGKIKQNYPDTAIIVSGGDQIGTPTSEVDYDNFIVDELSGMTISVTNGLAHDNASPYAEHYNLPNLSSLYGVSATTSDYYYTYNSTLFIHLNVEDTNMAEHAAFLEGAIAKNPDAIWRVVVIHYSFFSGGSGSVGSPVKDFCAALSLVFAENGIDIVLSGHDHVYARSELMLDATTVSGDVVTNNTVTDPEGVLYLSATSSSGTLFGSLYNDDYTAYQNDTKRKSIVRLEMSETSMTLTSYYIDTDTPEAFDSFTIYRTPDTVRLNGDTSFFEIHAEDGNTRIPLVNAYAYESATLKVVDGYWSISTDKGESFTSLGIKEDRTELQSLILALNEDSGSWELSEDNGVTFDPLVANVNRYKVTFVPKTNISVSDDFSAYATTSFAGDEIPDAPNLILPSGPIEEGILYEWAWKYCLLSDGTEVSTFAPGNAYVAYLTCETKQVSDTLSIAATTDEHSGLYSWSDAFTIAKGFPETSFTLRLSEDITLSQSDVISLTAYADITVDLAGYTLDATALDGHLIYLGTGSDGTRLTFLTSAPGGTVNAKTVFLIGSGARSALNLSLGASDASPLTVNCSERIVDATNNFKNSSVLNLSISNGTYNATSIFYVRNVKTDSAVTNYKVSIDNANFNLQNSPISIESGYKTGKDSSFSAARSVFVISDNGPLPIFSTNGWYGKADFVDTSFNGITFEPSYVSSASALAFNGICTFQSYGESFHADKSAFASENITVSDTHGLHSREDGSVSTMLTTLEIGTEEGMYTLADAFAYAAEYPTLHFTLRLTENLTLTEGIKVTSAPVNVAVDLCGFTFDSTSIAYAITFGTGSSSSKCAFFTSVEGGTIKSQTLYYLDPNVSKASFTLSVGSKNGESISVETSGTSYIVSQNNSFKNSSTLSLTLYEGQYSLSYALIYIRNIKSNNTTPNTYVINTHGAEISYPDRLIYIRWNEELNRPSTSSSFIAENSTFKKATQQPPSPLLSSDRWLGQMSFTNCHFDGVSFPVDHTSNMASLTFGEGCTFQNYGASFNEDHSTLASPKAALAENAAIVKAGADTLKITASYAEVVWKTPFESITEIWATGVTPVAPAIEETLVIGENTYTLDFGEILPLETGGATYTASVTGGPALAANLTLYISFDFNVYVPVCPEITAVNGKAVSEYETVMVDDVAYKKIPYSSIEPKYAYATQSVVLTVSLAEGVTAEVTRYVSILGYAKALLGTSEFTQEKELMLAALAYIKEVSNYFDCATEKSNAAIDALLDGYTPTAWSAEGKEIFPATEGLTTLKAAALNLDNMPGFVICVAPGTESVTVANKVYTVDPSNTTEFNGETVCYIVVEMGIHRMLESFTVSAGKDTLTFNLDTYISRMNAPSYSNALYAYAVAAKEYKKVQSQ